MTSYETPKHRYVSTSQTSGYARLKLFVEDIPESRFEGNTYEIRNSLPRDANTFEQTESSLSNTRYSTMVS
jgi:hypothetical protein